MNRFTTLDTTIGDFFNQKDTIFRVPLYQREYSWSEENVYTLLEDLLTSESYFLGTFVLNNEFFKADRAKDIVDGQQRILTITIFWAVIRDIFLELKDKEKSNQIQSNYISNKDDDGNDEFKVSASNSASAFFQKNVQLEKQKIEEANPKTEEHKSIIRSYQIIREELYKELAKYETNQQKIEKLRKVRDLLKALQLIVIEVESEEDAFVFFETLNSRGTELSQSDLIKNHIFKNINKKNEHIEQDWKKIVELIQASENSNITQFIRHYWLSSVRKLTESQLFKDIKKQVGSEAEKTMTYEEFLKNLLTEARHYKMITSPSENDWGRDYFDIYRVLKSMQALNVSQSRSILLSLIRLVKDDDFWKKYGTKKVVEAIIDIEKFTFSFTSVVHKSPASLETIYSHFAIKLNEIYRKPDKRSREKIDRVIIDFQERLKKEFPTENEFYDNFVKIEYKKSRRQTDFIKYIFQKLSYDGTEQKFDHVTIEHILPQSPSEGWKLKKNDIKDYVNNIGNLLPLGLEYNRDASNLTLLEKVAMYKRSQIPMTTDFVKTIIKKKHKWNKGDINKRTQKLAEEAWVKITQES